LEGKIKEKVQENPNEKWEIVNFSSRRMKIDAVITRHMFPIRSNIKYEGLDCAVRGVQIDRV
jgi:hypothetical protein